MGAAKLRQVDSNNSAKSLLHIVHLQETDTGAVTGGKGQRFTPVEEADIVYIGFNAVATASPAATFSTSASSTTTTGSKNSGTRVVASAGVGLLALVVVAVFA